MGQDVKTRAPKLVPLEKRLMLDASIPIIAGQVLWLDAADATTVRDSDGDNAASGTGGANNGFSGTVATWVDKSGSGFNVTNATANQQPTYTLGALNGNNVLTFDGTNDKLRNTTAVIGGNDYTMFIVFDRSISAGRDGVFEMGSGGSRNALFVNESSNKLGFYANGSFFHSTSTYTAGTYEVVTMMHDITSLRMWRDNVSEVTATGSTRASTTGIFVGDDSSGGDELNGHIAEIIVYDRDLTTDERRDVENYLAAKWGRTLTGNVAPVLGVNTGATVSQSDPVTITNAMLASTDADNSESILQYKITDLSDYGTITNSNTSHTYALGEYFTQADIDAGYIVYTHGGSSNFTDSFSFTVSDMYTTTAASTFNLTITPDNNAPALQGWTLVSFENFEAGASGWSDNFTETNPYLTRFLGRHSNEGGLQNTFKTYTLSGTQDYTILTFDFYRLDSWDTEQFRIFIDDVMVFNQAFTTAFTVIPDGSHGNVSWTAQEITGTAPNFVYGSWNDQLMRFTVRIDNTSAGTFKLGFSSTTNQATNDESWGVDNVNIYEVKDGGIPGPLGIVEGMANGTLLGTVTAHDPDVADTLAFSITGGTGAGIFAINATTGEITLANTSAVDYETTTSYTLTVRVTDNGSPSYFDEETITINVIDRPENTTPTINALGPLSIAENTANNTVIGTITGNDADGDTITWSITGGNTDNIFAINSSTGAIRVNSNTNLNAEWDNSYTLTIQARDNGFGNLTATRNVIVNINSINEAPTFDIPQSFLDLNPYLRYNAATGNFYQYISTTTNNAAATAAASASLLNGVAGHLATISDAAENAYVRALGSGALWLGGRDSVTEGNWVWDGTGPEGGQVFSIGSVTQGAFYTNWVGGQPDNGSNSDFLEMNTGGQWTDVNGGNRAYVIEWEGADVMAALGNGPYSLAENAANGQSVGFAHARDPDSGDTLTYSVTGGTGAAIFAINGATGEITVTNASALDYETTTSYTLDLRVQDAAGLFDTRTVTINITDANDAPDLQGWTLVSSEDFEGGASGWSDNTTTNNTFLTRFLGRHSQEGGTQDTFKTYALSGTQDYTILSFDFYRLDSWETEQFRIFIDDVMVFNDTFTAAYKVIADGSSGSISWTVQEISGAATNIAFASQNDQMMRFTMKIDNNASGSIKLGFGSNLNSAVSNESWGVDNIDIYEVKDGGTPGPFEIVEGMANGTLVGTLTASDQDAGDTHSYSITGGTGSAIFAINATTGAITLSNTSVVDYETTTSYTLTVRVTDNGTGALFDEETITINVLDRPENNAPVLTPLGTITISENTANGTVIADANATDVNGDTITYSIASGNTDNIFSINATTGVIRVNNNANLNREWDASYTLQIRATDNGFGSLYQNRNLVVNISNVNEAPTFDIPQSFLNENPYLRYNPATGNFYRYVNSTANYNAATTAATNSLLNGVAGHLATISDAAENAYVRALGGNVIWLGGRDSVTEGQWVWQGTGPEGGQVFSIGSTAQAGFYTNWQGGQPDNGSNSDFLFMQTNGTWADINSGNRRYVIEWEGADVMAALGNGPYSLGEHASIGQSVGFVHARDADVGDTITYTITGGTGAGVFNIDPSTGEITLAANVNYEVQNSYTLDLRVQDAAGLFDTRTVTINITDQNDTPTMIDLSSTLVTENSSIGTLVATLSTVDEDTADTHIYTLVNDPSGKFEIANGNEIRTIGEIDYEVTQSFTITLRTDDGNGGTFDRTVVINVDDQMDTFTPPPATGGPAASDVFVPTEREEAAAPVDLLRSSLGGEQGAFESFYGDFRQIMRENVTFEIKSLLSGIRNAAPGATYIAPSNDVAIVDVGDVDEQTLETRYTNLRQAMSFLQQVSDARRLSDAERTDDQDDSPERNLPEGSIDRQFVDVMTYHKERVARLRAALLETA